MGNPWGPPGDPRGTHGKNTHGDPPMGTPRGNPREHRGTQGTKKMRVLPGNLDNASFARDLGPMGPWAHVTLGPWDPGPMGLWDLGPMGSGANGTWGPWGLVPWDPCTYTHGSTLVFFINSVPSQWLSKRDPLSPPSAPHWALPLAPNVLQYFLASR
jgi:hypothetical protein